MATAVVENATVRDGSASGEGGCGRRRAARGRRDGLCRGWRRGRERARRRNRFVRMGSGGVLSWLLMLAPAGGAMSNPARGHVNPAPTCPIASATPAPRRALGLALRLITAHKNLMPIAHRMSKTQQPKQLLARPHDAPEPPPHRPVLHPPQLVLQRLENRSVPVRLARQHGVVRVSTEPNSRRQLAKTGAGGVKPSPTYHDTTFLGIAHCPRDALATCVRALFRIVANV